MPSSACKKKTKNSELGPAELCLVPVLPTVDAHSLLRIDPQTRHAMWSCVLLCLFFSFFFFFNEAAPPEIYPLPLHAALPIWNLRVSGRQADFIGEACGRAGGLIDRKSTRLNSSHLVISYAVFCLKKNTN